MYCKLCRKCNHNTEVVSSDNLAAVGVGDSDMTLATVEITKVKRENTTVIEIEVVTVKNGKRLLYCTSSKTPVPSLSKNIIVGLSFKESYEITF